VEVVCKCGRKKEPLICYKWYNEYDRNVIYEMNKEIVKCRQTTPDFKDEDFDKAKYLTELKLTYPKFEM